MNIKQLTNELLQIAEKYYKEDYPNSPLPPDTLTLSDLKKILKEKNIHYETFYDTDYNFDCHLIVLVDETWYYAVGTIYEDDNLDFEFYIDDNLFSRLEPSDIDRLTKIYENYKSKMETVLQRVQDPHFIKKIALQKTFSSIN